MKAGLWVIIGGYPADFSFFGSYAIKAEGSEHCHFYSEGGREHMIPDYTESNFTGIERGGGIGVIRFYAPGCSN